MLNYHHLRYFQAVAHEGNLTRAAEQLNVSQSALSVQIKQLEERIGQPLFDRVGRTLKLTEAGRIALDHADQLFAIGDDLVSTLQGHATARPVLRVGALSTLSRNFLISFLRPAFEMEGLKVELRSGNTERLLGELRALALDVVLTTEPPGSAHAGDVMSRLVAEQSVQLNAVPDRLAYDGLEALLENEPLILPSDMTVRSAAETLFDRLKVTPKIVAEVDDMALIRLLAREGIGVALAPAIVFRDELASGRLQTAPFDLGINEPFYAVTMQRKYPHPALLRLLD
ncbi:MAG: LysR family transcriptional regulator [Pseudomonadota bacterium]